MSGPDLAPQKFLLSQKFRHLMRCKKYLEKSLDWNFLKWGFSDTIHLPILIILCCEPNLRASVGSSMVPIMSCKTSKVSCCDYHFLASPSLHCHSFWIDVQSTECCVPVDYNNYRVENPQCWKNVGNAQDSQWTYTFLCTVIFWCATPSYCIVHSE